MGDDNKCSKPPASQIVNLLIHLDTNLGLFANPTWLGLIWVQLESNLISLEIVFMANQPTP